MSNYFECNWTPQTKVKKHGWMNKKKKIQCYAVYKILTLDLRIYIGWKWKDKKKKLFHQISCKRVRMVIYTLDKT